MNIDISIKDAMPEAIEEMMEIAAKYSNKPEECTILNRRIDDDFDLQSIINEVARHYIIRVLEENRWCVEDSYRVLGFNTYQTCSNWMRKLNIKKEYPKKNRKEKLNANCLRGAA